jgi:hypothetical protein
MTTAELKIVKAYFKALYKKRYHNSYKYTSERAGIKAYARVGHQLDVAETALRELGQVPKIANWP